MLRNKLMTACSVALLTAALYGCSSGSDDGANMQVQDLQDQIAALEAALGEDQELTPEAITALKSEIASLEMDIDNDDAADPGLNQQIASLMDERDGLKMDINNDDPANLGLNQQITALDTMITTLTGERDGLEMQINNDDPANPGLNQQLMSLTGERDGLEMQINNDDPDNPGLDQQLMSVTGERDGLEMQINNDDAANPGLNQQITALDTMITTLTGERDGLEMQINNDDAANPGLNQQITALDTMITTLTGERDGLEMQINNDDAANPGLNQQITALDTIITTLTGERDGLEMQINNEDPANPGLNQRLATVTSERDGLKMQINNDDAANPGLNQKITALEAQINNEDADNPGLNQQITALMAQINSVDPASPGLDAQITKLENEKESLQNQVDAFATARNAQTDAEGFATAADKAMMDATAASMKITARDEGVAGNSATAEENAQAVLDAETAANKAVDDADAAVQSAKDALAEAEALPSDNPNRDTLIAALEGAIEVAEGHAKAAADSRGDDDAALASAVKVIKGADPEAEGYPMTPAQHGTAVAMDVATALVPAMDSPDGSRARGMHGVMGPEADAAGFKDAVTENDHQGSTWAEIVGAANVVEKRIAATGAGTEVVSAASFAGMPVSSVTGGPAVDAEIADGTEYPAASYMGIPGRVFCAGSCMVEDVAGTDTLTGSWFFTPEFPKVWYVESTGVNGVTTYGMETLYARFGHWLVDDSGTGVNTFASSAGGTDFNLTTVNNEPEAVTLTDTSANYSGPAAGMSVFKTVNSDSTINTIDSAKFTATVNLKATFGAGDLATLGGTVTNFVGDATDPKWSVELQVKPFTAGALTDGRTVASGENGVWTAQAYGADVQSRPTGIFGGFNAHFTDGHAAGAYATR